MVRAILWPTQFIPTVRLKMLAWYFRWMNIHSKGMPEGHNLKYKIWNAVGHVDHGFVNGKDKTDGICQVEALDMGKGEKPFYSIRHPFDLREYGLTEERGKELNAAGCFVDCFDENTPSSMLTVDYMKKVLYHNIVESQQLNKILPKLYAEYRDKPDDEW